MYYLQRFNSITINLLNKYKYTLAVFTCFTLFIYMNLNYLEEKDEYYDKKLEYNNMLLTPEEVNEEKKSFDYIIDVRTPEEFEKGHLENAINVPHDSILKNPRILFYKYKISKDDKLFLYCKSGNRSSQVIDKLLKFDYEKKNLYFSIKPYEELKKHML